MRDGCLLLLFALACVIGLTIYALIDRVPRKRRRAPLFVPPVVIHGPGLCMLRNWREW